MHLSLQLTCYWLCQRQVRLRKAKHELRLTTTLSGVIIGPISAPSSNTSEPVRCDSGCSSPKISNCHVNDLRVITPNESRGLDQGHKVKGLSKRRAAYDYGVGYVRKSMGRFAHGRGNRDLRRPTSAYNVGLSAGPRLFEQVPPGQKVHSRHVHAGCERF